MVISMGIDIVRFFTETVCVVRIYKDTEIRNKFFKSQTLLLYL